MQSTPPELTMEDDKLLVAPHRIIMGTLCVIFVSNLLGFSKCLSITSRKPCR